MSAYDEEFVNGPLEFMNKYAVVPDGSRYNGVGNKKISTGTFSFSDSGFVAGGNAVKALTLSQADSGFQAYWLAYEQNKSKRAVLGSDAKYMFTANMDGCSFGYGSKTGTGEVLVGHANAMDVGGDAESDGKSLWEARGLQKDAQYQMLKKKMDTSKSFEVVHPFSYGDPFHGFDLQTNIYTYAATVFGLYLSSTWKFYMQRRIITIKGQFILRDTIEL